MLQFKDAAGYTWYFNHLISFIILGAIVLWSCAQTQLGKQDKFFHVLVSSVLSVIFLKIFLLIGVVWWWSPVVVMLIGIGKEVWDYLNPKKRKFDLMDLLADLLGIVAVSSVYIFSFIGGDA